MSEIDSYWLDVSDLSIFEAAFWMQMGADPRQFEHRCKQDRDYDNEFIENPSKAKRVYEKCEVLISAIRVGLLKPTTKVYSDGNGRFNVKRSLLLKADWLDWLSKNGYSEVVALFKRKISTSNEGNDAVGHEQSDWRVKAREIAEECFDNDTANNCRSSLAEYSERVMIEMQKRSIHSPRGRIVNPKTIQRDALQGAHWWAGKRK